MRSGFSARLHREHIRRADDAAPGAVAQGQHRVPEWGWQNGGRYAWIFPHDSWEEGLWSGLRSGSAHSLRDYLHANHVQKHLGVHNLESSWMLCANLYFPFGRSDHGRALLAGFLHERVHPVIRSVDAVELEYAESDDLEPVASPRRARRQSRRRANVARCRLCGERWPWTHPDREQVCRAFLLSLFRARAGRKHRATRQPRSLPLRPRLSRPGRSCRAVSSDGFGAESIGRILAPVVDRERLLTLRHCPAAYAGYQLFRQQALAEGIASSGKYAFVASCLAVDDRNETLRGCLKGTGIADIQQWGDLFVGKAHFAVFTHQQWVSWVHAHGEAGQWAGWLSYVEERYGFLP